MKTNQLHIIKEIFKYPLPGKQAHTTFARNLNRINYVVPDEVKLAGVLAILFPNKANDLEIVFTERMTFDANDKHGGQMSFPGGKKEDADISLEITALRETHEEIGIHPDEIQILGALSPLYIPVSNFLAHPYVGMMSKKPNFIKQDEEVAEIVTCNLAHLLSFNEPLTTNINITDKWTINNVPYFDVKGKIVWGATSMMLNELLVAIKQRL